MNTKLIADFKAARRCSTPILAVTTPDPAATIEMLGGGISAEFAPFRWDIARGLVGLGKVGQKVQKALDIDPLATQNPVEALMKIVNAGENGEGLPKGSVVFMLNAHLYLREPTVLQAVWNVRDEFKVNMRTLVLLGPMMKLPPELEHDVIVLDEQLPTSDELEDIVRQQCENTAQPVPSGELMERAVNALEGLAAFTAEQIVAMSLSKAGLDIDALWERKRQAIELCPGLSVWRGGETFSDIGGCENVKSFVGKLVAGKRKPRAIVFIDEIEKMLAGAGGDTSGVSQDALGQLLAYMQDHKSSGLIFIGPPGAAKSLVAKATGNTAQVPTIQFDLGGMKGSLVGESEARIRQALKVVTAVSQDQALFIATSNNIASLPPELKRRFKRGTFFFDLPTKAERAAIWSLYQRRFDLDATDPIPADTDWTGAEIQQCCEMSWEMDLTLVEASAFVVPVAKSAAAAIKRLREDASGKFISAAHPGTYDHEAATERTERPTTANRNARLIES